MTRPFKAVIPAGGHGTRLLQLTRTTPKEMLPLGSKPVLQHIVDELRASAVEEIVIVSRMGKDTIREHFAGQPRVRVIEKQEALGVGHSILFAREFLEDRDFVVAFGDSPLGGPGAHGLVPAMMRVHAAERADCVAAVARVPESEFHLRAIVALTGEPRPDAPAPVTDLYDKPLPGEARGDWAIAGRYTFGPAVFDAIERGAASVEGEIGLAEALRVLMREGRRVLAVPLGSGQVRYDVGNKEGYREAARDFSDHGGDGV